MTAPTSPKPHTPADLTVSKDVPATLDNEAADAGLRTALTKLADELTPDERAVAYDIRALLAAHPAPAPVSDTRREDVVRALALVDSLVDPPMSGRYGRYADAVLAVLPAPPVVDEAEIAKVLAEFDSVPWANMRRETKDIYRSMATAVAARLRGATRG